MRNAHHNNYVYDIDILEIVNYLILHELQY